ncbi:MAG: aminotransferase class I/II-fold pyridoxal phosphate-dependent enzyme [Flavobacteriaceae bacterium]|nr:aminotransferase class I/II-fold pyridoxal phosphate-dependent enzyme [Flavobacteriaceae bacterium]
MSEISRRDWIKTSTLASAGIGSLAFTGLGFTSNPKTELTKSDNSEVRRLLYNENPNGPSTMTKNAINELIGRCNRYSTFHESDYTVLKNLIAQEEGLSAENVLLGHGSFEPLIWTATHFGSKGEEIVVPSPTFDVVGLFARTLGAKVVPVEVDDQFNMDLDAMEARISSNTSLVTICNPNNPTGTAMNSQTLKSFCKLVSKKCPVLVDEAYIHYLENWKSQSMAALINEGANVLVTRTFSKIYGMAGMRIGFMLGPKELIKQLEAKFTLGFPGNMPNSLSVGAAIVATKDRDFVNTSRTLNAHARNRFYEVLNDLSLPYVRSHTNFVYIDVTKFKEFKSLMWSHKILLAGGWPSKPNYARVTMGSEEDMNFLAEKMQGRKWL